MVAAREQCPFLLLCCNVSPRYFPTNTASTAEFLRYEPRNVEESARVK